MAIWAELFDEQAFNSCEYCDDKKNLIRLMALPIGQLHQTVYVMLGLLYSMSTTGDHVQPCARVYEQPMYQRQMDRQPDRH